MHIEKFMLILSKELLEIFVITNKSGLDADPLFYAIIRVASRSLTSVHFKISARKTFSYFTSDRVFVSKIKSIFVVLIFLNDEPNKTLFLRAPKDFRVLASRVCSDYIKK
jgi:hypothetical protein